MIRKREWRYSRRQRKYSINKRIGNKFSSAIKWLIWFNKMEWFSSNLTAKIVESFSRQTSTHKNFLAIIGASSLIGRLMKSCQGFMPNIMIEFWSTISKRTNPQWWTKKGIYGAKAKTDTSSSLSSWSSLSSTFIARPPARKCMLA